ncbi:MAG: TIGR03619 family F420-dependent LLM class oxidoreductase [Proteobacteria bacterium]|nr:TIGR03619 family F420-dependent LLM class oxidoreductase [Pseudomonadota bacterium]
MKFGFSVPNNQGVTRVADLVAMACQAEQLGFNSVWVSEHLFHATYVARRLGDRPYHEALTVLTAIACSTDKVRLGTSVLVLPWHHPARLAKTIASLDDLSDGRVDLGVGVAVTEDEFANLGVPFNTRGKQTNDTLAALRALWSEDLPGHNGPFYQFEGLRFEPKPRQNPLPIHVGGNSNAALQRAVTFGQGWHALIQGPDAMAERVRTLKQLMTDAGRRDALHISLRVPVSLPAEPVDKPVGERQTLKGTQAQILETIAAYAGAGVDELILDPTSANAQIVGESLRTLAPLLDLQLIC